MKRAPWSGWQALAPSLELDPAVLAEILDGGQAFRWRGAAGVWAGVWSEHVAQLRLHGGRLEWRAPSARTGSTAPALARLLGVDLDWRGATDALPWRSDPHLARCLAAFPGLRLLRQPFGETLLCFLCSATKQIVQIKQMVALLAERHGGEICRAASPNAANAELGGSALPVHRLPTWTELAAIPEKDLRDCLLGFRARFIHETAVYLSTRPGWLDATEGLPYPAAKARLLELPGVGEKVADCVLLFGAGRLEAFPVDTWVLKALARRYGLEGWRPAQVAHFGRTHFGPFAGLAQQYLFAWERRFGRGPV
ncbi:MAG TPA: DNA glycosylase [Lacunisphaera sp.]|jgi:N-glycosylase/DNA lyase|nr:DNA glycosylase [Lacunisphaera sp.]